MSGLIVSICVSAILRRSIQFKGRHKLFSVSETQLMYNRSNLSFFKPNFNGKYFYELAILSDLLVTFRLRLFWLLFGSWHHLVCFKCYLCNSFAYFVMF